ncbi:MAG: hypothetical protein QXS54_05800 [Candidatus Methanomethylicaceae archaeon]
MPRAIASPDEIRKFAHILLQNVNRLRNMRTDVSARFNNLHEHWQDPKYERFRDIFTHTMNHLDVFLQQAEAYIQYLHRKAEKLQEYLRHKY